MRSRSSTTGWASTLPHSTLQSAPRSVELSLSTVALPELVEASSCGRSGARRAALEQLSSRARASGTSWALGLAARSRALISAGPGAEDHYREAIERLARHGRPPPRPHPPHLRRVATPRRPPSRCTRRAPDRPRNAHRHGGKRFRRTCRPRVPGNRGERPQAYRPAHRRTHHPGAPHRAVVATGATTRGVGEQLFLSPRTIEAHLRNIFRKLAITSRRELRELPLP